MANANRAARIEAAADSCRDNAVATVIDRMGLAKVQALDFNEYQFVTDQEKLAQAAYFADEHQVTTQGSPGGPEPSVTSETPGHRPARKADDMMNANGPTASAVLPSRCPGCSGSGVFTDDPQVLKCTTCSGIFTDAELPIAWEQALKFVGLNQPMLANAGPDGAFYFDLDVLDPILADGKTMNRLHGWADRKTKRVVQWG